MKEILVKGVIGYDVFAKDIRKELPPGSEKICLLINSPGGDVFEAFEIYNLLKEYPGKVTARITGLAASAAADLFFGADERETYTHAALMYHRAWTFALGNAAELREEADILDALDKIRIQDYARVTGKSLAAAMNEFTNETWLIGAEQMTAAGIPVAVVDGEPEEEKEENTAPAAKKRVAAAKDIIKELGEEYTAQTQHKIAAMLRHEKQDTPAQAVDHNSLEGEINMKFEEFIKQNPGAESEVLAYAKPKIGPEADKAAVKAESDRILKILALAGVRLSDDVKAVVSGGTTPEEYAINALTKQREIEARLQGGETAAVPGAVSQTPGEQAGVKPGMGAIPDDEAATPESVKALAKELAGRR